MRNSTLYVYSLISLCTILLSSVVPAKAAPNHNASCPENDLPPVSNIAPLTNSGIGNWVWEDIDYDGVQDVGEPGVANVTMLLYRDNDLNNLPDGPPIGTTQTGTNGSYQFLNLNAGNYIVECVPPPGGYFMTAQTGNSAGSSFSPSTRRSNSINLEEGELDNTIDAGLVRYAQISGTVWDDLNANGYWSPNEPGIAGVSIELYIDTDFNASTFDGAPIATTTTNGIGSYSFLGLLPSRYQLKVIPWGEYILDNQFGSGFSNTFNPATQGSNIQNIISGENINSINAGIFRYGSIGDKVWQDVNPNGIQDNGEPGIPNVMVRLYPDENGDGTPDGTALDIKTTDATGQYQFNNLFPRNYIVEMVSPPGFSITLPNIGSNDQLDSDISLTTGRTGSIQVISGQNEWSIDGGFVANQPITFGGTVWHDTNYDGLRTPDETTYPQTTIQIFRDGNQDGILDIGTLVATATTNAAGQWRIFSLLPGYYIARVQLPASFGLSPFQVAPQGAQGYQHFSPITQQTATFSLLPNETRTDIDAGLYLSALVGDIIFNDTNNNGVYDAGESGIPDVTVQLFQDQNLDGQAEGPSVSSAITNVDGEYSFSGLIPGNYLLHVVLPLTHQYSSALILTNGNTAPFTLQQGAVRNFEIGLHNCSGQVDRVTTLPDCAQSNGTIELILNNMGLLPQISWHDGSTAQQRSQLAAGIYAVTITTADNCIYTAEYHLNNSSAPDITASSIPVCAGEANGSANVTVFGGTPPYEYQWGNGTNNTTSLVNIPAGQYPLTVTDTQQCKAFSTVTVQENAPIVLQSTVNGINCNQSSVVISAAGGTPGYTYQWDDGSTSTTRTQLSMGIYTVTITDERACSSTSSIEIPQQVPLWTLQNTVQQPVCASDYGSIQLQVLFATAPVTYLWADGSVAASRTQLSPGTYCVTVSVPGQCAQAACYEITAPVSLSATIEQTNNNCSPTATLQATVEGGTPPYSYDWSHTTEQLEPSTLSNLPTGTYTVTISDAQGCSVQTSYHFVHISDLQANITPASCNETTGSIELLPPAGIQITQYAWANGTTSNTLSALGNGLYTVTVTDTQGCTASKIFTVFNANGPQFSLNTTPVPCDGSTQGSAHIVPEGVTTGWNYLWNNAVTLPEQNNLSYGSYTVTVTQADGCTNSAPVFIGLENGCHSGLELAYKINGNTVTDREFSKLWVENEEITLEILLTNTGNMRLFNTQISNPWLPAPCIFPMLLPGTTQTCQVQWSPQPGLSQVISTITAQPLNGVGVLSGAPIQLSDTFLLRAAALRLEVEASPDSLCVSTAVSYTIRLFFAGGYPELKLSDISGHTIGAPSWVFIPYHPEWTGGDLNSDGTLNGTDADGDGLSDEVFTWQFTRTPVQSDTIHFTASGLLYEGNTYLQGAAAETDCAVLIDEVHCGSWSGFVWEDNNLDAVWQPNEAQMEGISLELYQVTNGNTHWIATQWTDANGNFSFEQLPAGTYRLRIIPPNDYLLLTTETGEILFSGNTSQDNVIGTGIHYTDTRLACVPAGFIQGTVRTDISDNCTPVANAAALPGRAIHITSGARQYYAWTDALGQYRVAVVPDQYFVQVSSPISGISFCQEEQAITVNGNGTATADFWESPPPCPQLEVSMMTDVLRRCFNSQYLVFYQNHSSFAAENVSITVDLDDNLILSSATHPYTNLGNNRYQFQIGSIPANTYGSINLYVYTACTAFLGSIACSEATIEQQAGSCLLPHPEWSGAIVDVRSECITDSLRFILKNTGTGPMTQTLEYIVIEDGIMGMHHFGDPLAVGQEVTIAVPANGSTWSVEAEQEPFAPAQYSPTLSVEGCTTSGSFSTGWVAQFPEYDAGSQYDRDCEVITGSYDPNDKRGYPEGYGTQHYIAPGTPLTYTIRFQNTGNDTAFTVVIADTLSTLLNPASIRPLGASHPYTFDLTGEGIAVFRFDSIMLPDSIVNEPASHGFVRYQILPRADTPLESDILNQAAIYFDYNDPIFTNTTTHRLGEQFIVSGVWTPVQSQYSVEVTPNPATQSAVIRLMGSTENGLYTCTLYNSLGKIVQRINSPDTTIKVLVDGWPEGIYWFDIQCNGKILGKGKLFVQ